MKLIVKKGTTSKRVGLVAADSASTAGAGKSSIAYNAGGLTAYYWREDDGNSGGTAITIANATLGTFTSGGWKEKNSNNMTGGYEFGIPNAVLATGANWALICIFGASGMAPIWIEIQLVDIDLEDAVRLGLSALPNAAAASSGGLPTAGTGNYQLDLVAGRVKPWVLRTGTAQAGASASITLDAGASSQNNIYNNTVVAIVAGTGAGQTAQGTDYNGTTKVLTVDHTWIVTPDNTSVFEIQWSRTGGDVANVVGRVLGDSSRSFVGVGVYAKNEDAAKIAPATDTASSKTVTDKLSGMIESSGGHDRYKATALEEAPTGGGGGTAPTAAENAAAVRAELTAELANMDSPVSDCLQASGYTAPNNAGISAAAASAADIQTRIPAALDGSGNIKAIVQAMGANTVTAAAMAADASAEISAKVKADLEADHGAGSWEVADLLEPMDELTEEPGATPTLPEAVMWEYMKGRNNRTATKTVETVYNDAGTAIATHTLNDDGTTFTRGKAT